MNQNKTYENTKKIELANIPTPIQKYNFSDCNFLVKRDDLTGVELTGNKVRKLEYLLYEAKKVKQIISLLVVGINQIIVVLQ